MHPEVSEKGPGKCPKCGMDLVPRTRGGAATAHRVTVRVVALGAATAVVTGELKEGDEVVSRGIEGLVEGSAIRSADAGEEASPSAKPMEHGSGH